jgi:aromatic ring hydroxylase
MITSKEYVERLSKMKSNIWMGGEKVSRDDERFRPVIDIISLTYDLAFNPEYQEYLTAKSHLTEERINRFTHIHQNEQDLLIRQKMTRMLCQKTGGCIQRCVGIDGLNALSVVTYEIDQCKGTEYHRRFLRYLEYFQENDITACLAQTDAKGDRSKRPSEQDDPDLYLRVVEERSDGIVVRGCKLHNSMAPLADEIIVLPTRAMSEKDKDWAIAFAIPADAEGIKMVAKVTTPPKRKKLSAPIANIGDVECTTIFDNVFVPWERVFLYKEVEFAGRLASFAALFHRHSYTGCKPALTDIVIGTTALLAEYNGLDTQRTHHIRRKIADLITIGELVYAAGISSAYEGIKTPSGTFAPNPVYVNVGRRLAGLNIYQEFEILADVAGGLPATLPYEDDFYAEEIGTLLNKYIRRRSDVSSENQHRLFRMVSDMLCTSYSGVLMLGGLHGGGSPVMEEIGVMSQYNLNEKKRIAKELAGIKD